MSESFTPFSIEQGLLCDLSGDEFPTKLYAWKDACLTMPAGATYFGYVHEGRALLKVAAGEFSLSPGMYFCVPAEGGELTGDGKGIVIARRGYNGFFQIGGPVEATGRLKYIDGCTDSLLIPPILMGDACLNLLCFPPAINQTPHTHPSMRVGLVLSGTGKCLTSEGVIPLFPGQAFIIHAHQEHSFATQREPMRVIAYHPDSDFGATHENHPMINRTMVNGESASQLSAIRTK